MKSCGECAKGAISHSLSRYSYKIGCATDLQEMTVLLRQPSERCGEHRVAGSFLFVRTVIMGAIIVDGCPMRVVTVDELILNN
ncbi:hypothetical protein DSLASN_27510 [Desulfoluna limicola]|uniref:Uncharacterized protein n=1 Tax=Desulfoluna limicola TaxID=2810562 RepID=A0ABN6F8N2_9BACT|nr:hypothetical protein DSLASN_27510 [Desulfoluna limicola]